MIGPFVVSHVGLVQVDGIDRIGVFLSAELPQIRGVGGLFGEEVKIVHADLVPDPAALVRAALEAAAMKPLWIADMLRKNSMTAINVDLHNAARDIRAIATDPAAVAEIVERAKGAGE
jgi:hypothetical protein